MGETDENLGAGKIPPQSFAVFSFCSYFYLSFIFFES